MARETRAAAPAEPVHHVKALQLQEVPLQAGSGCLARLENVLDLDNVLLDSEADVNVASRGLIHELKDRGVAVREETCSPCTLATFDGSHFEVTKRVRFGAIQVQTTAGPLLLRNTPAWVFEHEKEKHTLMLSRSVMERLGYSVDAILAQACDTSREWDMQDLSGSDGGAIHLIREPSLQHAPPRAGEINDAELRTATPDLGAAGDNAQAQVAAILADRVVEAADAGLALEEVERLRAILQDYQDVFRVEFGRDPPVRVEPLRIRLREGATPVRSNARRYPPAHMAYLDQHVQELLDNGLAFINPSSRWASPPRIVSKSDPGTYRMTVDMRAVNARTEPILWPMPILEAALGLLEGSTCYFTLDWFRGYWQLPLDPASQEMFSIMTHRGIITPTRVSMGGTDSVAYCQHVVEEVFRPVLCKGVLAWLDDILGYAADPVNLLEVLERVLAACRSFGLKLHPGKCHFFLQEAKWCGKLVSKEGIRHSPTRVQGLVEMPDPTNAGQLQQLMCAINWMRQHIPQYATLAAPLLAVVDAAAKKAGSRKSKQLSKVSLSDVGWSREHVDALGKVREALMRMVPLAHPDPAQAVCLFCDASQDSWGAICTQVAEQDLGKPLSEQEHLPLAFLSGRFTGAQLKWPTIEKEAYAIVESAKRLEYLLLRPGGFHHFTDHRNLVYMFNPFATDSGMQRYQADKLQRWSMTVTTYRYVIEHVRGEDNIWADLLSRWGSPPTPMDQSVARVHQVVVVPAVSPLMENSFEWPTHAEICAAQQLQEPRPEHVPWNESKACFVLGGDRVWIPDKGDLIPRICVVAHAGRSGHRGERTTTSAISAWCWWPKLREDMSRFVKSCIHCVATRDGKEPRPYGPAIHATVPNEVLHFDYLTLPEDEDSGNKYILVLKDDFSGFVELWATANPDASSCAAALQAWFNRYGVVKQWVSDQGTHFKNQVIDELAKAVGANHHFTTAYCPWANGTVEVVNRLLLKCMRAVLSERRLSPAKWESIVGMVQAALNQQPSDKLGGRAPVTAFMGLTATTPVSTIFSSGSVSEMDEGTLHAKIQEHLSSTAEALEAMHRDVAEISDQRRMQARARRAARAKPPNFVVGDFVLVASVVAAPNKLSIKWQGPKRVTKAVSDWIFEVEDLVEPHVTSTHHVSRLRFYAESAREVTEDLLQHALHAQGGHCVEEFRVIRLNTTANQWQVEVKWLGLDELENTWESYASLQTDVPVLLARYCEAHKEESQFAEMLQAVSRQPRDRLQRSRQSGSRHSTEQSAHPTRPTRSRRRR